MEQYQAANTKVKKLELDLDAAMREKVRTNRNWDIQKIIVIVLNMELFVITVQ